jgi:hypothetical protein
MDASPGQGLSISRVVPVAPELKATEPVAEKGRESVHQAATATR